ncbi:substrate-binding domain-containing protein [Pseudogracilibacillus sp. SE30717A]|uniref:LacI family DNA-binding transcriptional regulator n=1 Tax=Pseudogracilibacillus sp. SE30717A TaxID=3098293 RepID=UPI00300DF5C0
MKKRVTIHQVATKARVSKSTVSQYLNGRYDYMGNETKKRIAEVIKELNYQPNVIARSLKTKTSSTIGVIVANILHSFSTQVIRSIENICHAQGISTIICNADNEPEKELYYIQTLLSKQVDGLIVIPMEENTDKYNELLQQDYPLVFMDRIIELVNTESIILDNELASELAIAHLIENGYEHIAILTPPVKGVAPRAERVKGYKKTLQNHSLPIREELIRSAPFPKMYRELDELFRLDTPPDAIFSGNDLTLVEILTYLKENDMKVGKDLGIVTIDEVAYASFFKPSLTTLKQPTFEMGKKAAEILLAKINKQPIQGDRIIRYDPELIIRKSSTERNNIVTL